MIYLRMYNNLNISEWKPISHDGIKKVQYVEYLWIQGYF